MKKGVKLGILIGVLALLVGGYFILSGINAQSEKESEDSGDSVTVVSIADVQNLTIEEDGQSYELVKDGENWKYAEDESFPVDGDKAQAAADVFSELTVTRKLENALSDLSEYGLSEPSLTASAKGGDASAKLLFGNTNDATGDRYMMVDGDETVYTVLEDTVSPLDADLVSFIHCEDYPTGLDQSQVEKLSLTSGGEEIAFEQRDDGFYCKKDGAEYKLQGDRAEEIRTDAASINAAGYAAYDPSIDEISGYGIGGENGVRLEMVYSEGTSPDETSKTLFVDIGDTDETASHYYAMADGSKIVALLDGAQIDSLIETFTEDFGPSTLCSDDADDILEIALEKDGQTVKITRTEETDDEGNSNVVYTKNGQRIATSDVLDFLDTVKGVSAIEGDTKKGAHYMVMTIERSDGTTSNIVFYSDGGMTVAVDIDGRTMTIDSRDCDKLWDKATELAPQE